MSAQALSLPLDSRHRDIQTYSPGEGSLQWNMAAAEQRRTERFGRDVLLRVAVQMNCRFAAGEDPVAGTASEYLPAGIETFFVPAGMRFSLYAIDAGEATIGFNRNYTVRAVNP